MLMKRLFVILILALPMLLSSCGEEKDVLSEQRQKLLSYLKSTHTPGLIPESEVEEGSQLPYYSISGNSVYRYIANIYDPGRDSRALVTANSLVTITFRAYVFNYSNIRDETFPFYSNDPLLKAAYEELGLTPDAWSFEPLTIDMRGNIINGLRDALLGCREGDEVEAYMTYNMAFGDKYFGTIPKESPIAWFFTVNNVE